MSGFSLSSSAHIILQVLSIVSVKSGKLCRQTSFVPNTILDFHAYGLFLNRPIEVFRIKKGTLTDFVEMKGFHDDSTGIQARFLCVFAVAQILKPLLALSWELGYRSFYACYINSATYIHVDDLVVLENYNAIILSSVLVLNIFGRHTTNGVYWGIKFSELSLKYSREANTIFKVSKFNNYKES